MQEDKDLGPMQYMKPEKTNTLYLPFRPHFFLLLSCLCGQFSQTEDKPLAFRWGSLSKVQLLLVDLSPPCNQRKDTMSIAFLVNHALEI